MVDLFYYFHISEKPIGSRLVQICKRHVAGAMPIDAAGRCNLDLQRILY